MSYVKTQWVNNTTPINDTNLNKIEQGIYDNSLVVDAVTNTINPTDTEIYKTAELTEGQITDVIGISDIVIQGNTEQNGTPTPSAPVDVNVVSGSNVVSIDNENNKNLFDKNSNIVTPGYLSATGSVVTSDSTLSYQNKFIKVDPNTSYTISSNTNAIYRIAEYNSSKEFISRKYNEQVSKSYTITTSNNTYYIKMAGTLTTILNSLQIEQSSTSTTYEPHQGKELPLDLPVKNLINVNEFTSVAAARIVSNATSGQTVNGIMAKPGTYIASFNVKQLARSDHRMQLIASSDSTQTQSGSDLTNRLNTVIVDAYQLKRYSISITIEQECYLYLRCVDTECVLNEIQLEKGSKANAYTPYDTDPIELCKIGNYQDYFYKSGSKWYLHKEVGSFILNGNVYFQKYSSSNSYYTTISSFTNNVPVYPETNNIVAPIICTHFDTTYINDIAYNSVQKIGFSYINSKEVCFGLPTSIATNVSEVQNWLNNQINNGNPVVVRYALATSTDTEITNTTLISQLEAIYNAPLYEETNITQTNNDLPMVLDITACKDNINGIKAFIRK